MFASIAAELRRIAALSPRRFADLDAVLFRMDVRLDRRERDALLTRLTAEGVIGNAIPLEDGGVLVAVL